MEAILKFNLPEDHIEFEMAVNASKMHSVLWEMDQWLRSQYKYMPDAEYSEDKYNTFEKCRDHLREIMIENGLNFD